VPSARNVSFNSQYNFKVIILFYLFRVGRAFGDKDVQLRKQTDEFCPLARTSAHRLD